MLDKLSGVFAPKPSAGPHKSRECLPLVILLRNRLRFALTKREVLTILKQRLVRVDGKIRTDTKFPAGFMDVVAIDKVRDGNYRLLFDVKGRFVVQKISAQEAKYKLGKVRSTKVGPNGVPQIYLHDGRNIRYPDPLIKVNDTVKVDLETGKITDFVKYDIGNLVMVTGGHNLGRVGLITSKEKHPGSFDITHIRDAAGHSFSTRTNNVFVIGKGTKSLVSLPWRKGIKRTILQEAESRLNKTSPNERSTA
eukprot:TRINITY_DN4247_c0_g1_i2.p1 TRINITY_DN4247_c0_g1~~TRINITY_DN4247_c0_g1_i2.p1  ORF type:complete len:251 (+),score=64.99 TRINITY_DN4247_c0_g1_i2:188-940(+)